MLIGFWINCIVFLDELGSYQAAFLKNRSVDDHIFVIKRFLEVEWTVGRAQFVLSLDLSKAFDEVDLGSVVTILKSYKIPHNFINRIIKTCLWENTGILWNGECSPSVIKSKGVKQGCPLSPRLFTLVMDAVLQTLAEQFDIDLNYSSGLKSPLVLAYADDVIIVCNDKRLLTLLFHELKDLFLSVNLKFNISKTELMVRDPCHLITEPEDFISLGSIQIRRVHEIKYLGKSTIYSNFLAY